VCDELLLQVHPKELQCLINPLHPDVELDPSIQLWTPEDSASVHDLQNFEAVHRPPIPKLEFQASSQWQGTRAVPISHPCLDQLLQLHVDAHHSQRQSLKLDEVLHVEENQANHF